MIRVSLVLVSRLRVRPSLILVCALSATLSPACIGPRTHETESPASQVEPTDDALRATFELQRGRRLEEQGEFFEAREAYRLAETAPCGTRLAEAEAVLGQARCAVAFGQPARAEELFRRIVDEGTADRRVLAGAWNGLGDLSLEEGMGMGTKRPNSEKILDGLHNYLRVVVLFAHPSGESCGEYERALSSSARCFDFIAQLDTTPKSKAANTAQAQALREQLARVVAARTAADEDGLPPK